MQVHSFGSPSRHRLAASRTEACRRLKTSSMVSKKPGVRAEWWKEGQREEEGASQSQFSRRLSAWDSCEERHLSPNALYYRVLGKSLVSVRVDEKDPERIPTLNRLGLPAVTYLQPSLSPFEAPWVSVDTDQIWQVVQPGRAAAVAGKSYRVWRSTGDCLWGLLSSQAPDDL